MFAYVWFALPPDLTGTPNPAIASFGAGVGFSPCNRSSSFFLLQDLFDEQSLVLLVVIVPQLVPMRYVSTTLGAHKSVSALEFARRSSDILIPVFLIT